MNLGLDGKSIPVTGGSKGIGLVGAKAFAAEGACVAAFLASGRASYVTGAVLTMDGGSTPIVV